MRATQRDVWQFIAYLTDAESADDLAQDTFLRALRGLPGFAGRSSARTWLLSIARRTVVDRYRRSATRPQLVFGDAAAEVQLHEPSRFEDHVVLVDLLTFVPQQRREAFVLTQVIGLSYAEAAAVSGCALGTVRSRVARARAQLLTLLHSEEDAVGAQVQERVARLGQAPGRDAVHRRSRPALTEPFSLPAAVCSPGARTPFPEIA
ncbi:sigma-70 family RNA polymerase sigma factor [Kitasatospora sp. GAS1066B]|uniref:sigma-70 family RNA polymerase sigma factor n=1 Tax=Kitasatospora sp. GAS1066B TaxID=3156271 RepID=UPI0035136921